MHIKRQPQALSILDPVARLGKCFKKNPPAAEPRKNGRVYMCSVVVAVRAPKPFEARRVWHRLRLHSGPVGCGDSRSSVLTLPGQRQCKAWA